MSDASHPQSCGPSVDEAFRCLTCGYRWYYTKTRCPACEDDESETFRLGEGKLVAVAEAAVTPPDVRSPNLLGLARFDGIQLLAQLARPAAVGDWVRFAGEHRLRAGDERPQPRLMCVDE